MGSMTKKIGERSEWDSLLAWLSKCSLASVFWLLGYEDPVGIDSRLIIKEIGGNFIIRKLTLQGSNL